MTVEGADADDVNLTPSFPASIMEHSPSLICVMIATSMYAERNHFSGFALLSMM